MASINSYHYAYNNPVNLGDPTGLSPRKGGVPIPTADTNDNGSRRGGGGFRVPGFSATPGIGRMGWSNGTGFNSNGSHYYGGPSSDYYLVRDAINSVAGLALSAVGSLSVDFGMLASGSYTFNFSGSGVSFTNASVTSIAGSWFGGPTIAAGSQTSMYGNEGGTKFYGRDYNSITSVIETLDASVDVQSVSGDQAYIDLYSDRSGDASSDDDSYSMIPVVGPLMDATINYNNGDYGWAAFNAALAIAEIVPVLRLGKLAKSSSNVLTKSQILRIENAATRINKPISVVGSRASGKAGAYSDWDYVIHGGLKNSREWSKIKNSLPGARSVLDNTPRNIDILPGPVWPGFPHITIFPR